MGSRRLVPSISLLAALVALGFADRSWAQAGCDLGEGIMVPEGAADCVDGHVWKCAGGSLQDTGVPCAGPAEPEYRDEDDAYDGEEPEYGGGTPSGFPGGMPQGFPGGMPQGIPGGTPQGFPGGMPQGLPGGTPPGPAGKRAGGLECGKVCAHVVECGTNTMEGCMKLCATATPEQLVAVATASCEAMRAAPAPGQAAASPECKKVCAHVVECGTNTMEGCLSLCATASREQLVAVAGASCEAMRASGPRPQPASPFGEHGGGTGADCMAIGGSLGGLVCSGPPFPCRSLGCPPGWSCGIDGQCHSDRFPNCKRCP